MSTFLPERLILTLTITTGTNAVLKSYSTSSMRQLTSVCESVYSLWARPKDGLEEESLTLIAVYIET